MSAAESTAAREIAEWEVALTPLLNESSPMVRRLRFVQSCESTQQIARERHAQPGDVIITARQTAGRGRLGRAWADTGAEGVAITIALTADAPERLAIAGAVASARAIERAAGLSPGIKWPNDIIADGRKLAGVLIEQDDRIALMGIGINVNQRSWPSALSDHAVSLAQLGIHITRLRIIEHLLQSISHVLQMEDEALSGAFAAKDVLAGTSATFRLGGALISGTVLRVEPMRGLLVQTVRGERWLPAATTSVHDAEVMRR